MAWSRLQSASAIGTGGNPSVAYGTNLTSGSKLIAAVALDGDASETTPPNVWTVKDGSGNTMTFLGGITQGTNGGAYLYAMDTPSGDVGTKPTITATFVTGGGESDFGSALLIQEVSGLLAGNTTGMLDGSVATNDGSSSGPATSGSYTSSAASEYLVAVYGDDGGNFTYTVPSGYTGDANNVTNNTNAQVGIAYKNSAGASESASWTLPATTQWETLLVAFQLAGPVITSGPALGQREPPSRPSVVPVVRGWRNAGHSH